MARLLLQKQSHLCMNLFFFLFSYILRTARGLKKKTKMWGEARYLLPIFVVYQEGQKHRYGSTPVSKIRVDP